MKQLREFINEKLHVSNYKKRQNFNEFKDCLKKFDINIEGPDSTGIAYITTSEDNINICIEVNDKYWTCYLDEDNKGKIFISLDENGEPDEEVNTDKFDKIENKFSYSDNNAKLLADAIIKFKNK